ncbi:hypothetical protein BWI17_10290 [Betaproteobacteria bacterium GR16-43]|nr:hypothetical protein BWI17_10290 [Betaproteobacteria bacterium GR16-43]
MKGLAGVLVLAITAIAVAMFLRGGKDLSGDSPKPMVGVPKLAPSTVLRIAPGVALPYSPPAAPKGSPLYAEMAVARAYKPIYDRLRNSTEGRTPEGLYYLARILDACANVPDRKIPRRPPPDEEAKAKFIASISAKDPNRAARLAAYDAATFDVCAGLRDIAATDKEIRELREQALAAGEAKARARNVADEVFAAMKPVAGEGSNYKLPTITDAQLEALKEVARTGDPGAIQTVGSVLASTLGDLYIRAGPHEMPVDPRAFYNGWMLASCELGANCGRDNRQVAFSCAYDGNCGVDNLRDFFFYYETSPAQSQMMGEYSQQILAAVRTGDWSYFQFVRGSPPAGTQRTFRFGGGG